MNVISWQKSDLRLARAKKWLHIVIGIFAEPASLEFLISIEAVQAGGLGARDSLRRVVVSHGLLGHQRRRVRQANAEEGKSRRGGLRQGP